MDAVGLGRVPFCHHGLACTKALQRQLIRPVDARHAQAHQFRILMPHLGLQLLFGIQPAKRTVCFRIHRSGSSTHSPRQSPYTPVVPR